ncbi:TetR/AcrR family transcriptional regulator [Streptosporangium amethystogenes]|uniref:TetR/AcrR family transcriptional regulator n=1 Tax=Streptosporangium amethystogenes TaxID=2002 RepID=UPI00378742AC
MAERDAGAKRTLREAQKSATLEKLIDASREVFKEHGYSATIDQITRAAGASRATFYLHFGSKGEVLARIYHDDYVVRLFSWLDEFPECSDLIPLKQWVRSYMDIHADNKEIITACLEAGIRETGFSKTGGSVIETFLAALAVKVAKTRRRNEHETSDEEAYVRGAVAYVQMQQMAHQMLVPGVKHSEDIHITVQAETWQYTFGHRLGLGSAA